MSSLFCKFVCTTANFEQIMKYHAFLLLIAIVAGACSSSENDEITTDAIFESGSYEEKGLEGPKLSFEETIHDFGEIVEGEKESHTFHFTNTGDSRLIISNVSAGCGCTVASYSRKPIMPGDEGYVEVEYDSQGRMEGRFAQSVTIVSNASPNRKHLQVSGEIIQNQKPN